MTEPTHGQPGKKEPISKVTLVASAFVLLLAIVAMLGPGQDPAPRKAVFLILDPAANDQRIQTFYTPLVSLLSRVDGEPLDLEIRKNRTDFEALLAQGARYVLCPDGEALKLDAERYVPLVRGRRAAPQNLRPRGALLYRKRPGVGVRQWLDNGPRVVLGDTLSLLIRENLPENPIVIAAVGPDALDHGPVLHALRLADHDYALVRYWDAMRFFDSGLLSDKEWALELLGESWPDLVLLGDQKLPASRRVKVREVLAAIGRDHTDEQSGVDLLVAGLKGVNLAGFNLLLEPDFELVRKRANQNWPPKTN